jgi:LmbE family N-acetylglucosaminyl deacetylase
MSFMWALAALQLSSCSTGDVETVCNGYYPKLDSTKENVLLVVAHQDDDAFIVTRLKEHIVKGDQVMIVWTTKSYQDGNQYANVRINEAKNAMKMLGVDSLHYKFLDFPDTRTYKFIPEIIEKLKAIIQKYKPNIIYTGAYEMGNIDHDVTNFSTVESLKELKYKCMVYEFPEYSAYNVPNFLPFEMRKFPDTLITYCRELTAKQTKFVIKCWRIYHSQEFPFMQYLYFLDQENLIFKYEYLRVLPNYDYTKRPFNAAAAYGRYVFGLNYKDFHQNVVSYLNSIKHY